MVLWTGQAVSALGTEITLLAFPLLVLSLTGSAAQAGIVAFFNTVPVLLLNLPGGVWVDRHDRRLIMAGANLLGAVSIGGLAALLAVGDVPMAVIVCVAFVQGAAGTIFSLAEHGALPRVVPSGQLPDAVAQNEGRTFAAQLIGPAVGGALFGLGRAVPFLVDAVSYLLAACSLALLRTPLQADRDRAPRTLMVQMTEGVRWLWHQPFLRDCALLVAVANFVWAGVALVLIVEAERQGASPGEIGLMLALLASGGLLGALLAPSVRRRLLPRTIVVGAFSLEAILIMLLGLRPHPFLLGGIAGLASLTVPPWNAVVIGARLVLTPDELIGRVNSAAALVAGSAVPVGALLGGVAAGAIGTRATFVALGLVAVLVAASAATAPALRTGLNELSAVGSSL